MNAVVLSGGKILGHSGAVYSTPTGASLIFDYPSGFNTPAQANFNPVGGSSGWSGNVMQVADGGGHVAGAFWYQTAQISVASFFTTFTFTLPNIIATITAGNPSIVLNNNYTSGEQVLFAGQFGGVTGVSQAIQYYVSATGLSSTAFQISATNGGSVITPGGTGSATPQVLAIIGMTFCVQNSNPTTNPNNSGTFAGADANVAGYGAYTSNPSGTRVGNSVAIKFDTSANSHSEATYPYGGVPTAIGVYVNGGPYEALIPQEDLNPFGIYLGAGNLLSCTVFYDGTYLTTILKDTVTGNQCRRAWPINIAACIGGTPAWIGFTAGELFPAPIQVYSWTLYQGINSTLASPTFSPTPGSYTTSQTVSISGPSGSAIYYTTNGLPPTTASTLYTGSIAVSSSTIIQAVAIRSGFTDSYVAFGNYQIATAGSPLINFPSGFATLNGLITLAGSTTLSGTSIRLTDIYGFALSGNGNEVGVAWYTVPVSITTFSTTFTYKFTSSGGTNGLGMTFCIQNYGETSSGSNAVSWMSGGPYTMGNQSGFGYSGSTGGLGQNAGLNNSVALALDVGNNEIGLFTDGANPNPAGTSLTGGINLSNGHPVTVAISYNGTTLSVLITDTVNADTFSTSYTVNIPSLVGANTAYVGFTAGEEFANSIQDIQTWTYQTP